jgi:endonuclease III-like uncharacterized protein
MVIPDIYAGCNLLRYELRYTKRINQQFKTSVTANKLYDEEFYHTFIQNWYNEFQTIHKLKSNSFMTDNITTTKDATTALFAFLLQEKGQGVVDEYIAELKAKNTFKDRQRYSELKRKFNALLQAKTGEQSDLMKELETVIHDIARYAE